LIEKEKEKEKEELAIIHRAARDPKMGGNGGYAKRISQLL
jgi:hypothetical protein